MGNLYFQFCILCRHQPGGISYHGYSSAGQCTLGTPLTRIAEIIAVSAIVFASIIIVVDMGRPERFLNLFIHGRLQSPIMWDVIVIGTYFFISLLLFYFPLLPDLKILIQFKEKTGKALNKLYRFQGSFWKGTEAQFKISDRAINILCIIIIPVAFCIHTVTSWLFATTYRPGWDSTNFGAYFISGAFLVGAGAVVVAMYVFRRAYHLKKYITEIHFEKMGRIVVLLALLYLYFNINEYLVPAFKMKKPEEAHLNRIICRRICAYVLVCHFGRDDHSDYHLAVSKKEENHFPCLLQV